ncbi:MAG: hypothetical protein HKN21_05615 [Candidatus Eisenbacteria bacterium]|uniref:Tetratricopeptide repeat protein n=1 Tax=Eiseniibacteriota bacterium TaxID=2212470 RepID=A0A7Y2H207_UNCEI|nr:hypothetical protein [Candidatus Eisenbacteria bacterium]
MKVDGGTPALPLEGPYSKSAWRSHLDGSSGSVGDSLESALRMTFAADISLRNYNRGKALAEDILREDPDHGPALVIRALASWHLEGELARSLSQLEEAQRVAPEWGVPSYEIAYLLSMTDRERGRQAFQKADALGIKDTRNLGRRFYNR